MSLWSGGGGGGVEADEAAGLVMGSRLARELQGDTPKSNYIFID